MNACPLDLASSRHDVVSDNIKIPRLAETLACLKAVIVIRMGQSRGRWVFLGMYGSQLWRMTS